jgi:hypothetical protein
MIGDCCIAELKGKWPCKSGVGRTRDSDVKGNDPKKRNRSEKHRIKTEITNLSRNWVSEVISIILSSRQLSDSSTLLKI